MVFSSAMYPGETIIDDSTPESVHSPEGCGRGLVLPFGDLSYEDLGAAAQPFPTSLEIDESEWQARIQEMEEKGERMSDRLVKEGIKQKDQNGVPYCWSFGPTQACEGLRMLQGEPYVSLSPASVGAPITGFKKTGGWGKMFLERAADENGGICPSSLWPDIAVDRKYFTDANKETAKKYRCTQWYVCKPRNKKQLISSLLRLMCGGVGYNWWEHEVYAVDPVWQDGTAALRIRNQWQTWNDRNNFGILKGDKMLPDDYVIPILMTAMG